MATMNISLPEKMKAWVESRTEGGRYANVSDYMRDLIRKEQEKLDYIAYIQKAVDEGEASRFSDYNRDELLREIIASDIAK